MNNPRSDQDILAGLLSAVSHGRQGEETAARLLRHFGSLKHVFNGGRSALMKCGLSEPQAALLTAMHPVARRCALEPLGPQPDLRDGETLRDYVRALYVGVCNERFMVIGLDKKWQMTGVRTVAEGTMREIPLQPRALIDYVVRSGAAAVIFAHNHPGGHAEFSRSDIQSTQIFANYLRSTGVGLVDHLLCAEGQVVSMRETSRLPGVFCPITERD